MSNNVLEKVIGVVVALLVAALLLPLALEELGEMESMFETDGALEDLQMLEPLLLVLLPLMVVIAVVFYIIDLDDLTFKR